MIRIDPLLITGSFLFSTAAGILIGTILFGTPPDVLAIASLVMGHGITMLLCLLGRNIGPDSTKLT